MSHSRIHAQCAFVRLFTRVHDTLACLADIARSVMMEGVRALAMRPFVSIGAAVVVRSVSHHVHTSRVSCAHVCSELCLKRLFAGTRYVRYTQHTRVDRVQ
jgi:hypothetical protein